MKISQPKNANTIRVFLHDTMVISVSNLQRSGEMARILACINTRKMSKDNIITITNLMSERKQTKIMLDPYEEMEMFRKEEKVMNTF